MIVQLIKVNLKFTYIQHCCEPLFIDLLVFTQLFPRFVIKLVHLEVLPSTYKHFLVLVERGRVHLCGSNVVLNLLIPTKERKHHHILGLNHCLLQSAYVCSLRKQVGILTLQKGAVVITKQDTHVICFINTNAPESSHLKYCIFKTYIFLNLTFTINKQSGFFR